jgi:hypothetical protein
MHHKSESRPRPEPEPDGEVHILDKKIEPFWPFLDGLVLGTLKTWPLFTDEKKNVNLPGCLPP